MSVIRIICGCWEFNRGRTLAMLDAVEKLPDPRAALGWRPGPGRAHVGWQLMHVAITEELFATERLLGRPCGFPDLVPRFKGGSTPDDDVPEPAAIRETLDASRRHLLAAVETFADADLETIPEAFRDRGWTIGTVLRVIAWHEPHHQGQAHLTLNLRKAAQGSA